MTDIYIDGSFKGNAVGYGVRIEQDNAIEHFGGRLVNPVGDNSLHEYFAYIEAALLAKQLGLKPADCHFITDCDTIVHGAQSGLAMFGHAGGGHRDALLRALIKVRKYYGTYSADAFSNALMYLSARFSWQRGHTHSVGNRRADHLATCGRTSADPIAYDKWLKQSYSLHVAGKQTTFYAPFVASYIERDGLKYQLTA